MCALCSRPSCVSGEGDELNVIVIIDLRSAVF